jgi:hypothetical protein
LGTRHRAGIGITEETDAVAVIVSEETGAISLAVGGTVERHLTVEQLRSRLGELLRKYLPPTALPTSITNEAEAMDETALMTDPPASARADGQLKTGGKL